MICDADVSGDELGSTTLTFVPQSVPIPGLYEFDVAEVREGGSAGAVALVLQTILLPLALADDASEVKIKGGTHVAWSPSFHYICDAYLPALARWGASANVELLAWGWYPAGSGEIKATIPGRARLAGNGDWQNRGELQQVKGIAVASSLPAHIAQRIRNRAVNLLDQAGMPSSIEPQRVRSNSPGAGIFLTAEYENVRTGFTALGKKGKPSEQVAQEAVDALLAYHHSGAVVDEHLADQLVVPAALAEWSGTLPVERVSNHTLTNLWVVEQFLGPVARVDQKRNLIIFR
jgi:RNA 3'-terminal phosphate cyclase (ATP)